MEKEPQFNEQEQGQGGKNYVRRMKPGIWCFRTLTQSIFGRTIVSMGKVSTQEKSMMELVRRQVAGAIKELLSDPDAGLVLNRKAELRLKHSVRSGRLGKMKPLNEILKKYRR